MKKELKCIMLIDDSEDDNYFHEREIKKMSLSYSIITQNSGGKALEYLKSNKDRARHPDLIFLDINMPGMNGWEFLQQYNQLDKALQSQVILIMLTTSENPDDIAKVKTWNFVSDYITKPLNTEVLKRVFSKYFK